VPDTWSAKTSQVLRAIRAPRPSKAPGRPQRDGRIGKKAAAKLRARIAALEAAIAERSPPPVEIESTGSLKLETRSARAEPVENPRAKTGERPLVDSRAPDPAELEARSEASAARDRAAADAWRKHQFVLNLMASRGLGVSRWSSPYWRSSPYRSGF
jgi:hypothetical protein